MNIPFFAASCVVLTGASLCGTSHAQTAATTAAPTSMSVPLNTRTTIDVGAAGITGVAVTAPPAHGVVTTNGTRLTYTPARDFFGADSFSYVTFSSKGASPAAVIAVSVTGRPNAGLDPALAALVHAQGDTARRFTQSQSRQFQNRLESLHLSVQTEEVPAEDAPQSAGPRGADVWLGGAMRFGSREAQAGAAEMAFRDEGISTGIDRRIADQLVLGAGLGFSRARNEIGFEGGNSRASSTTVAGYVSYQPAKEIYFDGVLGYAALDFDSRRHVAPLNTFAHASRSGQSLFASLAAGMELANGGLRLSPYGRLDLAAHRLRQADERDAGRYALRFDSQRFSSSELAIGLRAGTIHETDFGWAMPRLRLEFQRELGGTPQATVGYLDQPGTSVQVGAWATRRNALLLGIGGEFVLLNGLTLSLDYLMSAAGGRDKNQMLQARLVKDLDGKGPPASLLSLSAASTSTLGIPLEAGISFDNNVNRGDGMDMLSDSIYSLQLSKRRIFPLDDRSRLVFSGFLDGEKYRRYNGLGRIGAGAEAEFQYRTAGIPTAPTFGIFARLSGENYDSTLRDGQRSAVGVSYAQAFSPQFSLHSALTRNLRNAKNAVFDTRDWSARLHLDYRPRIESAFYAGLDFRRGDLVSSSRGSLDDVDLAEVLAPDDVFRREQFVNYRFDGKTVLFRLGHIMQFGPRDALDISWKRTRSVSDHKPGYAGADYARYNSSQFSISYTSSF